MGIGVRDFYWLFPVGEATGVFRDMQFAYQKYGKDFIQFFKEGF